MEGLTIALIVGLDLALLLGLAAWAARGGTPRVLVGLALSALFGVLVGVPVFAAATLVLRRRATSSASPSSRTGASRPVG